MKTQSQINTPIFQPTEVLPSAPISEPLDQENIKPTSLTKDQFEMSQNNDNILEKAMKDLQLAQTMQKQMQKAELSSSQEEMMHKVLMQIIQMMK